MLRFLPVHPLIQFICFFVLVVSLVNAVWFDLGVAAAGLTGLYIILEAENWGKLRAMLWRLRWFFLSISVFYFWFTPGIKIFASMGSWSPSWYGLDQGLLRVSALILIISSIHLILQNTTREALISGIYAIVVPFKFLVCPHRLALRIILTLDAVASLQAENFMNMKNSDKSLSKRQRLQSVLVEMVSSIQRRAENAPCGTVKIPEFHPPPYVQWLLPVGLGILFAMIGE